MSTEFVVESIYLYCIVTSWTRDHPCCATLIPNLHFWQCDPRDLSKNVIKLVKKVLSRIWESCNGVSNIFSAPAPLAPITTTVHDTLLTIGFTVATIVLFICRAVISGGQGALAPPIFFLWIDYVDYWVWSHRNACNHFRKKCFEVYPSPPPPNVWMEITALICDICNCALL